MKVATWNVNGIRARHTQVQDWIDKEQPDVVALQEIKATCSQVPTSLCELEGYWCYWHGGERGYSGVALHVRKDFSSRRPLFLHPDFDFENRIVIAQTGDFSVASIYVPNGGKDLPAKMRFLAALDAYADTARAEGRPLILCGDLNVARGEIDVHPKERNPRLPGQMPEERALFQRILGRGLLDTGRALHPGNEALFTWWAPWRNMRARNIGWRLDYILASARLGESVTACYVQSDTGTSDHAPVIADFRT